MFRRQVWFLLLLLLLYWRMTPFYFKTISVFSGDGHKMAHCRIVIQYVWNRYVWSGKSVRDKKISVRHLWKKEVAHSIHLTLAKSCHPYCIFFSTMIIPSTLQAIQLNEYQIQDFCDFLSSSLMVRPCFWESVKDRS